MFPAAILPVAMAACHSGGGAGGAVPGDRSDTRPFAQIEPGDAIHVTGTEPFWGGDVTAQVFAYKTAEQPEGRRVTVARFAGRGGLSFSGMLEDRDLTLAITPGACSDGMSDRAYQLVATLRVGEEIRTGCAWTDAMPYTGPKAP
jgi:uncharacterized membrane protein